MFEYRCSRIRTNEENVIKKLLIIQQEFVHRMPIGGAKEAKK